MAEQPFGEDMYTQTLHYKKRGLNHQFLSFFKLFYWHTLSVFSPPGPSASLKQF